MGNMTPWFAHHYPSEEQHQEKREEEPSTQHECEIVLSKRLEQETNCTYVESMTTRRTTTSAGMRSKRKRDDDDDDDDDDRITNTKACKCRNKRKEQLCSNVDDMSSTVNSQYKKENSITAEDVETMKCTCYIPCSAYVTSDQETTTALFFTSQDNKAIIQGDTKINETTCKEEPLCRCVCFGDTVEQTYGCHYHLYKSTSPAESHGVALGWSLRRQPLRLHSLLTLGRVANSCRKKVVLIGNSHDTVVLQYAAEL